MGILGTEYTSLTDMFDGGGAGGSGDSYFSGSHADYVASGGTGGVAHDTSSGHTNSANTYSYQGPNLDGSSGYTMDWGANGTSDNLNPDGTINNTNDVVAQTSNGDSIGYYSSDNHIPGSAPTGISTYTTAGMIGKLAGWANNLNSQTDVGTVVDGQMVYTNVDGMKYSHNFLGLPYEVAIQDGKVVDKLSLKDPETGLTGYQKLAQAQKDQGNHEAAAQIMEEAEANAGETPDGTLTAVGKATDEIQAMQDAAYGSSNLAGVASDPSQVMPQQLSDYTPTISTDGTIIADVTPGARQTVQQNLAANTSEGPNVPQNTGYNVAQIGNTAAQATAQQGSVDPRSQVNAAGVEINTEAVATGTDAVGKALNDFATVNMSHVVDTSTVEGKLLAQQLGVNGYVDAKSTILGQMELISAEFKDANGNPRIPTWAQGTAANVAKTISFGGMTGTAATASMSNAIMQASLGIAEKEASFFQTLTVENLSNEQQSIIQKANVLSNMEIANLGVRETAAVQNAQGFLQMDLANLDTRQQTEVLNTQIRVDSLFADVNAKNVEAAFGAEADMFYEELAQSVRNFNTTQQNEMKKTNASQSNFQAQLDADREQFYSTQQYNIDRANAEWRQAIALQDAEYSFAAAQFDTQSMLDISQEAHNRLWDREDSNLDYIFKAHQYEQERDVEIYKADRVAETASAQLNAQRSSGIGSGIFEIAKWLWPNPFG